MQWRNRIAIAGIAALSFVGIAVLRGQPAGAAGNIDRGSAQFSQTCAACHGPGGIGGDRGPALVDNRTLRARATDEVQRIIHDGTSAGMPAFSSLSNADLQSLVTYVRSLNSSAFDIQPSGDAAAGERFFFGKGQCGSCHMALGKGKPVGPDLSNIGRQLTLPELTRSLTDPEASIAPGYELVRVRLSNGTILEGFARNEGNETLPLVTPDGQLHSLDKSTLTKLTPAKKSIMPALSATADEQRDLVAYLSRLGGGSPVAAAGSSAQDNGDFDRILHPKAGDWPTYHGRLNGNRYSTLAQITAANVHNLSLQWIYPLRDPNIEMTPLVVDGVMYITAPDRGSNTAQVSALDARSGREIWRYTRPKTQGLAGDTANGLNRGVAVLGDRVFVTSDHAVLLCLNRLTGALMWQTNMIRAENAGVENGGTSAPLIIHNMVVAGVSGGDEEGLRGFIAAHDAVTGKEVWRFWTVPRPGEPGSETWKGSALARGGGGGTWLPGTYDEVSDTLYWPTGNPYPDEDGSERIGDNLYTDCILALDAKSGKLKWYYQNTPHDLHDWDSEEPPMLVDAKFQGQDRKLLIQANRNGFFYVLDRTNGKFLLGTPFVKKLTWASGIGPDGRPQLLPNNETTAEGTTTCPAIRGATNWMSTSYNPSTGLFYVMSVENCSRYNTGAFGGNGGRGAAGGERGAGGASGGGRGPAVAGAGRGGAGRGGGRGGPPDPAGSATFGGIVNTGPGGGGEQVLRAIDIQTGKVAWEVAQTGSSNNYAGTLSTAGGVVFYARSSGEFAAADAKTGRELWHFETQEPWKASPMTYVVNGRQYVAIASGLNVLSFALPATTPVAHGASGSR